MKKTMISAGAGIALLALLGGTGLAFAQTGTTTDSGATTTPPTLSVTLLATPNSGTLPLAGVDFKATVTGTATGTINYTLYCDRADAGTNVTTPFAQQVTGSALSEYTATDLCTYSAAGVYTGKVIATRGGLSAEGRTTITVSAPTPTTTPTSTPPIVQKGEWKLEIGPAGRTLLRGNIDSISGNVIKVRSWGGVWTIRVNAAVELLKFDAKPTDLTNFTAGDYVGVSGIASKTETMTIDGHIMRNWTEKKRIQLDRRDNEKLWKNLIKDTRGDDLMSDRIVEGTIGTTSGNTFTLVEGGVTITVTTTGATKFIDKNWNSITLADITPGSRVRVFGDVTGSTAITAEVVRNTSTTRETIKFEKEKKEKEEREKKENRGKGNDR